MLSLQNFQESWRIIALSNENGIRIEFIDDNGNLKDKDTFTKEMANIYDQVKEEIENECEHSHRMPQFIDLFCSEIDMLDPDTILNRYQFIERKLYLDTEIVEDTGRHFLERIQFWNSEDEFNETPIEERIPIQIYIDSPGGLISTSFQIIDMIQKSETPVITVATGTAYSGAFFILTAGHKRYAFPNATFLFHEGSGGTLGDAHKVLQQSKFYESLLRQIKNHVLKTTKIPASLYEKHEKDDWYFNAKKALKLGVIDEISTDVNGGITNE